MQWAEEKVPKDKQCSSKHYTEIKRSSPLKTGGDIICSEMVGSSCSTSGTCRVDLVTTTMMISHEWAKDRVVLMTRGTYSKKNCALGTGLSPWYVTLVQLKPSWEKSLSVSLRKHLHGSFFSNTVIFVEQYSSRRVDCSTHPFGNHDYN